MMTMTIMMKMMISRAVIMIMKKMITKTVTIMITKGRARVMDGHPVVAEEDSAECQAHKG